MNAISEIALPELKELHIKVAQHSNYTNAWPSTLEVLSLHGEGTYSITLPPKLRSVTLEGIPVIKNPEDLFSERLQHLNIPALPVSTAECSLMKRSHNIKELNFSFSKKHNHVCEFIFVELKTLVFSSKVEMNCKLMAPRLSKLSIFDFIGNAAIEAPNLTDISINSLAFRLNWVEDLFFQSPYLKKLTLRFGISAVNQFPWNQIESISLYDSSALDWNLYPSLRVLNLETCTMTESPTFDLPNLEVLILPAHALHVSLWTPKLRVLDAEGILLQSIVQLRSFSAELVSFSTGPSLDFSCLSFLKPLVISLNGKMKSNRLEKLRFCASIEKATFKEMTTFDINSVIYVLEERLKSIVIDGKGGDIWLNSCISAIAENVTKLKEFEIRNLLEEKLDNLGNLVDSCSKLALFHVYKCPKVSPILLKQLSKRRKTCIFRYDDLPMWALE